MIFFIFNSLSHVAALLLFKFRPGPLKQLLPPLDPGGKVPVKKKLYTAPPVIQGIQKDEIEEEDSGLFTGVKTFVKRLLPWGEKKENPVETEPDTVLSSAPLTKKEERKLKRKKNKKKKR